MIILQEAIQSFFIFLSFSIETRKQAGHLLTGFLLNCLKCDVRLNSARAALLKGSILPHGLLQHSAHCAGTGEHLYKEPFNLLGKTQRAQVAAKKRLLPENGKKLPAVGLGLAPDDAGQRLLQGRKLRVGAELHGMSMIVYAQQIAKPRGDGQRNGLQLRGIVRIGRSVGLDGFAEANRDFQTCVRCDALRRVRNEGIRQAFFDNLAQKIRRVQNSRVCNDRHALVIADFFDKAFERGVLHFRGNARIAEQAAEDGKRCVQRIQTGRDLHALGEIHGFAVCHVDAGFFQRRAACEYAESSAYDAIILDVMMPRMDGFTALRRMRERGDKTPIMMLTARGETRERIEGFDSGADDYLPKPFDPDELLSRVRAMLRRSEAYRPSVLTFSDLTLDPATGELSCGTGKIRLSGREYQLMELFLRSPGMLFSADRLMEKIWGWDSEAETGVIWVNISNLRKKLKSIGSTAKINASRGLGYLLEAGK